MKKVFLTLSTAFIVGVASAQAGNNQISILPELGIPVGDFGSADGFKTGFGAYARYMHGIGDAGQLTLTSGYSSFKSKVFTNLSTSVIPILLGYRHNLNGFFIEGQSGVAFYKLAAVGAINKAGLTYSVGVGYALEQGVEFGVRLQGARVKYDELKESVGYGFIGLHVAYNFSLSGSHKSAPVHKPAPRTSRHRY